MTLRAERTVGRHDAHMLPARGRRDEPVLASSTRGLLLFALFPPLSIEVAVASDPLQPRFELLDLLPLVGVERLGLLSPILGLVRRR